MVECRTIRKHSHCYVCGDCLFESYDIEMESGSFEELECNKCLERYEEKLIRETYKNVSRV